MQKQNEKESVVQFSKTNKYHDQTICKISSPENEFIADIIACLDVTFKVEKTSPVMWNDDAKQFHVFVAVNKREA